MNRIDFSIRKRSVVIQGPELVFKDAPLDSAGEIILNKLSFEKFELDSLHLPELWNDKLFIADRLVIGKPQIFFTDKGGNRQSSFQPERLFQLLSRDTTARQNIKIDIGTVEIRYGSINLLTDIGKGEPAELLDFTIILYNFDTYPEPAQKREQILFSDDITIEITNLRRIFYSGYDLKISKAKFSTSNRKFEMYGASLLPDQPSTKGKNSIALEAGNLVLYGIDLAQLRGLEVLDLESLKISEGYFNLYTNTVLNSEDNDEPDNSSAIARLLNRINLDTLSINDFSFHRFRNLTDTLFTFENVDFEVHEIRIDSGFMSDPVEHIELKDIYMNTDRFQAFLESENLTISIDNIDFATPTREILIYGLTVDGPDPSENAKPLRVNIGEMAIGNVHHETIKLDEEFFLTLALANADIQADLDHPLFTKPGREGQRDAMFFDFEKMNIQNGSFEISKGETFEISVTNMDVITGEFDLRIPESFDFRSLELETGKFHFTLENEVLFSSDGMLFKDEKLAINGLSTSHRSISPFSDIQFGNLLVEDFNPNTLVRDRILIAAALRVDKPSVSGKITIAPHDPGEKASKGNAVVQMPFRMIIDQVLLTGGRLEMEVSSRHGEHFIQTGFGTEVNNLRLERIFKIEEWLTGLDLMQSFNNATIRFPGHEAKIKRIETSMESSGILIEDVTVGRDTRTDDFENFSIDNLELRRLYVNGLDHQLLRNAGKIHFDSFGVSDIDGDIAFKRDLSTRSTMGDHEEKLTGFLQNLVYNSLLLDNINLRAKLTGDAVNSEYRLSGFHFHHNQGNSEDKNLANDIYLRLNGFTLSNNLKNTYAGFSNLEFNPTSKQLSIESLDAGRLEEIHLLPDTGTNIRFNSSGFTLHGIYLKDELPSSLNIERLDFREVDLTLDQRKNIRTRGGMKLDIDIFRRWAYLMTAFNIDTARIENFRVRVKALEGDSSQTVWSDSLGLTIRKINIDTAMFEEETPDLISTLDITLKNKKLITPDSLYEIETGNLHYSFPERRITMDTLVMKPRYPEGEFFERAYWQTERTSLTSAGIELHDFHLEKLMVDDHIHFGSLNIHNLNVDLLRDKRYPRKPGIIKKMPAELLRDIEQTFTFDSIKIIDSYLRYGEISEKSDIPGHVFLDRLNITARNVTNNYDEMNDSTMKLSLDGHLMGGAKIELAAFFPLLSYDNLFTFSAVSETIDLTSLSDMTTHVMGLAILKGRGSINASGITGDDSVASGNMIFRYKKLRIALYDRKKDQLNRKFGVNFMNFMINDIVLKSNNPRFARKPRVGEVYFARDHEKSIVNYIWKSLMSGMLSTMGFNNKEQRQAKRGKE
jgi:hypothetical protein